MSFRDRPGWGDDLQRILVIGVLGAFVLGMGWAMAWGYMNERGPVPGEMITLVSVAIGFLGAIVKENSSSGGAK